MINLNESKVIKFIEEKDYYKIYFKYNKLYSSTYLLMRGIAIVNIIGIVFKVLGLDKNG